MMRIPTKETGTLQEAKHKELIPHNELQHAHDDMIRLANQSVTSASTTASTRTLYERQYSKANPETLHANWNNNNEDDDEHNFCIVVNLKYRKNSLER